MERYSRESFQDAVAKNLSFAGVLRALGLKQAGGTQAHVRAKIASFGIDTSHFRLQATNSGPDHKGGGIRKTDYGPDGRPLLFCGKCEQYRDVDWFAFKGRSRGVRQSHCKECHKAYAAQHYVRNKKAYSIRCASTRAVLAKRNRKWLLEYKAGKPCMDCGQVFHPCAMDFDHREGEVKKANVCRMLTSSLKVIRAEIAKCDLVCSNCHRVRTFTRYHARVAQSRGN